MAAEEFACPSCASADLIGVPEGTAIRLTCGACGHQWTRQPAPVCGRCGTGDPYLRRIDGWQYDDLPEARQNTMAAYDDVLYDEFRCRQCHHTWRVEVGRRTGRQASEQTAPTPAPRVDAAPAAPPPLSPYEDPSALLGRLRLGREEFCQRLLTMLILGGEYPRWNTRSTPTAAGLRFLDDLHRRSFGDPLHAGTDCVFVDEFELPGRSEAEAGGAPDYAVLTPGRLWLIELKTEKASHRHGQVPQYFELARYHHPDVDVDLTYLTPAMTVDYPASGLYGGFAHITWDVAAEVIWTTWNPTTCEPGQRAVVERLLQTLGDLDSVTSSVWRATTERLVVTALEPDPIDRAVALAQQTAADGAQRVLEHRAHDLEELQLIRLAVRERICAAPAGSELRRVMPWLWQPASKGHPMTAAGAESGFELRLSRYAKPVC